MKIGIIGSGNMGGSLGKIWAHKGHEVVFSFSQDPAKLDALAQAAGSNARAGTPFDAAQSDVVLISVWPPALGQALEAAGSLAGKVVVTCMSGLKPDFSGQTVGLPTDRTQSLAEELAQLIPDAHVVEAFNSTFAETLALENRVFANGERASLFYCGDHAGAKATVAGLIADADYEPVDAGGLHIARSLETLASVWVQFAVVSGLFPNVGLKAVRR